jgi:SAM-dependent methyltransferase
VTSTWLWEVAERDHELQNPTSPEKIRLLGDYLRLTGESRVLDVACGKGGPARILAGIHGCRVLGIELLPAFADEARRRVAAAGLDSVVEVRTADAAEVELEPEAWDAALCLGASFVWGTIADAAAALRPAVRRGGFVAIGEPYWRLWPLLDGTQDQGYVALDETVARFEGAGFATTGVIAASDDDWDHYESQHWRAVEEWLAEQPDHPGAGEFRARHERFRRDYFAFKRALLGWAIFVGRKP